MRNSEFKRSYAFKSMDFYRHDCQAKRIYKEPLKFITNEP